MTAGSRILPASQGDREASANMTRVQVETLKTPEARAVTSGGGAAGRGRRASRAEQGRGARGSERAAGGTRDGETAAETAAFLVDLKV